MLTRLVIRNLKRFDEAEIELGPRVVFVGPNNCGKTTALQALSLWHLAMQRWSARFPDGNPPPQRPGVVLGRSDLVATPVPKTAHLWRAARVGSYQRPGGKKTLNRTHIELEVSGVAGDGTEWTCAFELDYANPESINCRPRRLHAEGEPPRWSTVPAGAREQRVAFLPPMSGLADREFRKEQGEVDFLIGQGRTAEVLRNLCHMVYARDTEAWARVVERMGKLFGAHILPPELGARADLVVEYEERGVRLDLACAGRGMQQTLLLLTYMELNPGCVLLLDEPDAHLEVLRQAQIYEELSNHAEKTGSQIVAATHSEKLLNEAASRDIVVAFTGRPHRVDGNRDQVLKALRSIGFEHFMAAEQRGWVLYLEGSTDLAFLRAFAQKLEHRAREALQAPYCHYVENQPPKVQEHYNALRDAFPALLGVGIFDRLPRPLPGTHAQLQLRCWSVYEVENHVCTRKVLVRWAEAEAAKSPVFRHMWPTVMERVLDAMEAAGKLLDEPLWSADRKASEKVLPNIFREFHQQVGARDTTRKADYHMLVSFVDPSDLRPEVTEVLDLVADVAEAAQPVVPI